jgi:hypothetical protein
VQLCFLKYPVVSENLAQPRALPQKCCTARNTQKRAAEQVLSVILLQFSGSMPGKAMYQAAIAPSNLLRFLEQTAPITVSSR